MWKNKGLQQLATVIQSQRQYVLLVVFGLLLLLVVLGSAVGQPALLIAEVLVGLLLGVGALMRPRFALLLVFIGVSLPSLALILPGHTLRLAAPALFICIVIVIVRRPGIRLRYYHILALLFMGIAFLSFIHVIQSSTDPNAYAAAKRLYDLLLIFEAFFCGTFLVRYVKNVSAFLSTILLCHIPFYLVGLFQMTGLPLPTFLEVSEAQNPLQTSSHLWGPTNSSGTFGLYLVNLLAVSLSCYILGTHRRERVIGGITTIVMTLEIVGSGSRSAALGGAVVIVALLLLTRRYKLLIGMILLVMVLCGIFFDRVMILFAQDQAVIISRLGLWQVAILLIAAHPWLGVGLQQFHVYSQQWPLYIPLAFSQQVLSIHNQYLEFAMESGIIWLLVAALFLSSMVVKCWQAYVIARREQRIILMAAMLALLANMCMGMFEVPLDRVDGAIFLFILSGIAVGYAEWICRTTWRQKPLRSLKSFSPLRRYFSLRPPFHFARSALVGLPYTDAPTLHKTVRSIAFQLLCWGLTGPVMLSVTALLTRYLGPVQYGEYGFTLPFLTLCALLSGTGMDPLIIRRLSLLPRQKWGETLSYAAGSRLVSTTFSIIVVSLIVLLLPVSFEQRVLLLLGCGSLFFNFSYNGLRSIYAHGFQVEQRVTPLILLETLSRLLVALMVVISIAYRLPLVWTYLLIMYADLPCFLLLVFITRRRFGIHLRISWSYLREYLLGSLALTGYDALTLVTGQGDVLLLMLFTGPMYVGFYALAIRISDPLIAMAALYVNGVYPLLCSTFENGREQFPRLYREAMRIVSLAVIPLSIFVSLEANAVVSLVGGPHFAAAASVVQLLMWATGMIFYSQLTVRSCMAANMERTIPYIAGISAAINVAGNLFFIPHWQAVGAGIISLASEFLALLLFVVLIRKHIHIWSTMWAVCQVALGCAPMAAFLYWQPQVPLLLAATIALGLTILGCLMTQGLTWRDMTLIWNFLRARQFASGYESGDVDTPAVLANSSLAFLDVEQLDLPDIADYPTQIMPSLRDVADCPTLTLPRIRV